MASVFTEQLLITSTKKKTRLKMLSILIRILLIIGMGYVELEH